MRTLDEQLRDFLEYAATLNLSRHTQHAYRVNLGRFVRWLDGTYGVRTAERLRQQHLYEWLKHLSDHRTPSGLPLRPSSLNKNIENTRQLMAWLVKQGHLPRDFGDALDYVKEPHLLPSSVLTHAQVKQLIARIRTDSPSGYRDRAMIEMLYSTGVRVTELLTLQLPDVDLKNATALVMGKGSKQRVVPIGRSALRCLRIYLVAIRPFLAKNRAEQSVFLTREGKPQHYLAFRKAIHGYARAAGLEVNVTPHTFRRSCTTELLRGGANMYHVKELLGHENLNTLRHYAKLTIHDLKKTHEKCHPRERDESQTEA